MWEGVTDIGTEVLFRFGPFLRGMSRGKKMCK